MEKNRVGPDQTAIFGAVWSGSALFAQTLYLSQQSDVYEYPRALRFNKTIHTTAVHFPSFGRWLNYGGGKPDIRFSVCPR